MEISLKKSPREAAGDVTAGGFEANLHDGDGESPEGVRVAEEVGGAAIGDEDRARVVKPRPRTGASTKFQTIVVVFVDGEEEVFV